MPVDATEYNQPMTFTITRTGLEYTTTIAAAASGLYTPWTVNNTGVHRVETMDEAWVLAKHQIRLQTSDT